jgi:hypothetical protein
MGVECLNAGAQNGVARLSTRTQHRFKCLNVKQERCKLKDTTQGLNR